MITPNRRSCLASGLLIALLLGSGNPAWSQSQPLLGQIMCAPYNFAPVGWAFAQGQLLAIAQNTALFALIGTTYGGDGVQTFALPDLRGRVQIGAGQGSGLTDHPLGQTGGSESVTLSIPQMPAHTHLYAPPASTADATVVSPSGAVPATKARTTLYAPPNQANLGMAVATTGPTGGNAPVPTESPYVTVNCFIATAGVFPSRP